MAVNREHDPHATEQPISPLKNPEVYHDDRDIDVKSISWYGVVLVLVCISAFALLLGIFRYFQSREEANQPPTTRPSLGVDARRMPPMPRLQSQPVLDLSAIRAAEASVLNSYGWVDESKGLVRIPIDRAMDLLAQRGLPSRPAAAPSGSPVSMPTESGLGVVMSVAAEPAGSHPPPAEPQPLGSGSPVAPPPHATPSGSGTEH